MFKENKFRDVKALSKGGENDGTRKGYSFDHINTETLHKHLEFYSGEAVSAANNQDTLEAPRQETTVNDLASLKTHNSPVSKIGNTFWGKLLVRNSL